MIGGLIEMQYKKRTGRKQTLRTARQEMCKSVAQVGNIYSSRQLLEMVSAKYPHNQKAPKNTFSLAQSLRGCDDWKMETWPHIGRYGWRRVA